tara:strand:- start:283 stop:1161 length:879 start_codon:yes stop_codon:yes gene_type:complete
MIMNGWVFIDKPNGITSFQVINQIKKALGIKKIGHTGTLDPFATGILAIAIGEATKSIELFNKIKTYEFLVSFGELKDTDDVTGKTIRISENIPTIKDIGSCINNFLFNYVQVPPKYSAVKVNGVRAYKLARMKKNFSLKAKKVQISNMNFFETNKSNEFRFIVDCSTGTYIRSIARDLGAMLDTYAYVKELRRTKIGRITEKDIILLDKFLELVHIGDHFEVIYSIRKVLDDIPAVLMDSELSRSFQNGLGFNYFDNTLSINELFFEDKNKLLGIGSVEQGKVKPKKVFNL